FVLLSEEATVSASRNAGFNTEFAGGLTMLTAGTVVSVTWISSETSADLRPSASVACATNRNNAPGAAFAGTVKASARALPSGKFVAILSGPTPASARFITETSSAAAT